MKILWNCSIKNFEQFTILAPKVSLSEGSKLIEKNDSFVQMEFVFFRNTCLCLNDESRIDKGAD